MKVVQAFLGGLFVSVVLVSSAGEKWDARLSTGEAIYRQGLLASGQPLVAHHRGGTETTGADAACINCHRRSGLGSIEGAQGAIPPITRRYLMHPRARTAQDLDLPYVVGIRADRDPYTDATIARALRAGLDSEGRPLRELMPRFDLGDSDVQALIAYLKQLDRRDVPGVTPSVLHFATIVTPDADPVKRDGMLDVLRHFFNDRNAVQRGETLRPKASRMTGLSMFKVVRRWDLHVWQLTGAPDTWREQLDRRFAEEPVFAVVSGIGRSTWAPVHRFCEEREVPCLFPNIEVPVDTDRDFYSVYLSRGVILEAKLVAERILSSEGSAPRVVHQIYRAGDSGEAASKALEAALAGHGITVLNHVVRAPEQLAAIVEHATGSSDALVLWLRPPDIATLGGVPPRAKTVYLSGLMGGLEQAPVPAAWREQSLLTYPVDLPENRRVRVDYPLGWFSIRKIRVVDLPVQADTYLACGLLSETISHLVDTFVPEYLVERVEDMLEHRVLTGYYPRLTLGEHQRFASKGGYLVKFAAPTGTRVVAASDWLIP
jgi:hypothetical protein